ncbi:hypothetical protein CaCOL14_013157 [Colletotrichum acutatum]
MTGEDEYADRLSQLSLSGRRRTRSPKDTNPNPRPSKTAKTNCSTDAQAYLSESSNQPYASDSGPGSGSHTPPDTTTMIASLCSEILSLETDEIMSASPKTASNVEIAVIMIVNSARQLLMALEEEKGSGLSASD